MKSRERIVDNNVPDKKGNTANKYNPLKRIARRALIRNRLFKKTLDKQLYLDLKINLVKSTTAIKTAFPQASIMKDLAVLQKNESEILAWLKKNKKNLVTFALDPIDTLYKNKLITNKQALRNIGRFREANSKARIPAANIRLRKVTLTVTSDKPGKIRGRDE